MLDRNSYRLLKHFYKHSPILHPTLLTEMQELFNQSLYTAEFSISNLTKQGFIESGIAKYDDSERMCKCYWITPDGMAFLENQRKDTWRFCIPVMISIVAVTIAFISLVTSLISLLN